MNQKFYFFKSNRYYSAFRSFPQPYEGKLNAKLILPTKVTKVFACIKTSKQKVWLYKETRFKIQQQWPFKPKAPRLPASISCQLIIPHLFSVGITKDKKVK